MLAAITLITDPLQASPAEVIIAALFYLALLFYPLARDSRGERQRADARREEWRPAGSGDFRRAMRYSGVHFDDLGRERIAMDATAKREARRVL